MPEYNAQAAASFLKGKEKSPEPSERVPDFSVQSRRQDLNKFKCKKPRGHKLFTATNLSVGKVSAVKATE